MNAYIYPSIVSLPLGYDVDIPFDLYQIIERLTVRNANIDIKFLVFRAGKEVHFEKRQVRIDQGILVQGSLEPLHWSDPDGETEHAFGEIHCVSADDRLIFTMKMPFSIYAIYSKSGKKSFFSDNHYKYGSPPIIDQMAEFGQYVETYPVIHLDMERDLGETLIFINPYNRAINARVLAYDGRSIPKFQIPAISCRHVALTPLLGKDATWMGQIQLTANNRLIVFHMKHSFSDARVVSDHEHLDPFRAEPTHWPITIKLRIAAGWLVTHVSKQVRIARGGA